MTATIVIADDEPYVQRLLRMVLERAGHRVVAVEDGRQAVDAVLRERPPLVILDGEMPVLDGYGACAEIRAADLDPQPHVLVLTAAGRDHDLQRASRAGADAFATKPFSPKDLLARVRAVLDAAPPAA